MNYIYVIRMQLNWIDRPQVKKKKKLLNAKKISIFFSSLFFSTFLIILFFIYYCKDNEITNIGINLSIQNYFVRLPEHNLMGKINMTDSISSIKFLLDIDNLTRITEAVL